MLNLILVRLQWSWTYARQNLNIWIKVFNLVWEAIEFNKVCHATWLWQGSDSNIVLMPCRTLQSFPSSCKDKLFRLSHRFLSLNILHISIVVRVFDRWTCNQTCFNAARALKPLNNGEAKTPHSVEFPPGTTVPGCDFCSPLDYTAAGELFSWLLSHLQSIGYLWWTKQSPLPSSFHLNLGCWQGCQK